MRIKRREVRRKTRDDDIEKRDETREKRREERHSEKGTSIINVLPCKVCVQKKKKDSMRI